MCYRPSTVCPTEFLVLPGKVCTTAPALVCPTNAQLGWPGMVNLADRAGMFPTIARPD